MVEKNDNESYKFIVTLLSKKYPLTKATYCLMKSVLDSMLKHKLFNTLISVHGQVVKSVAKKLAKDMTHLQLGTDLIAFFTIGFQVHANYFIDE